MSETRVALVRPERSRHPVPTLDGDQRRVVQHRGGPLLVLAGPGTGKTTTLVETVVSRVRGGDCALADILVLTFSRKAAVELRERIVGRLAGTTRGPVAMTFHSYAYALLRRYGDGAPLRLLTGSEQDIEVRRLLAGEIADGAQRWPEQLRPAVGLRGFRGELRDLLQRAQERGLGPGDLRALGEQAGRADWVAAGGFLADYHARFDLDPRAHVVDQSALVSEAAGLLESDRRVCERERAARRLVLVDEYQDTDPAQVRLLRALCDGGRDLIAVGDPDQSIYGFRGAEVAGILTFPTTFPTSAGEPAPVVALRTCRRSAPELLAASRSVAERLPRAAGVLPTSGWSSFRELVADPQVAPERGEVSVLLAGTAGAETAAIADVLRRAHLLDGIAWSDMAVVLRSTSHTLGGLRRALLGAGVPVAVPADEVPLAEEPIVRGLLHALRVALRPESIDENAALDLLTGPLVRADALAVRRLRRALRAVEGDRSAGDTAPRTAEELLVEAVREPDLALLLPARLSGALDRVQALRVAARVDGDAEQVLWSLWQATGLAPRLEAESLRGGTRGGLADRALDAVIALFAAAGRFVDRLPHLGVLDFLEDVAAQEIPADPLTQRTPPGEAVRLLTAHAAKGLQWRLVVVAGVQEGSWPDLRSRGSLLGTEELVEAASGTPVPYADRRAGLLAEERRLFYVALTRARERVVCTAVASADSAQERPSRFLSELGVEPIQVSARACRPLTLSGLVADLRRVAVSTDDPAVREAACRRLARLATGQDAPRAAAADPETWWGVQQLSEQAPLAAAGESVSVSPSRVEAFDECSLRWFLTARVGLSNDNGPPQVLGSLVHALCELASGPDALSEEQLHARLEEALPALDLGSPWKQGQHRETARTQLAKFLRWARDNPRALVATELDIAVDMEAGASLRGRVDRLERDEQGRAYVVDLKTGSKAKKHEIARHAQLGVYQLAAALGAFADHGLTESGGASLLQLKETKDADEQVQRGLAEDADPTWAQDLVLRVVEGMRGAAFPATRGPGCQHCKVKACCPLQPEGGSVT